MNCNPMIPKHWARQWKQIAKAYQKVSDQEDKINVVRVVAQKLDYKLNENGDSSFVRTVIREYKKLT